MEALAAAAHAALLLSAAAPSAAALAAEDHGLPSVRATCRFGSESPSPLAIGSAGSAVGRSEELLKKLICGYQFFWKLLIGTRGSYSIIKT